MGQGVPLSESGRCRTMCGCWGSEKDQQVLGARERNLLGYEGRSSEPGGIVSDRAG